MAPAFWMCVGKNREYGKQLREHLENMREMCQCHGARFLDVGWDSSWARGIIKRIHRTCAGNVPMLWCLCLDVGGKKSQVQETTKRISKEYAGHVSVSWCLVFGCGWEDFSGTEAFLVWVGTFRGYGAQLREYVVNMGEMCQHHGACFLDLGGKCS